MLGGPAVAQGNLRGTAVVVMVLAVPLLATSMYFTSRNSARALVIWMGAVGYIIYQAVLFLFGTPFNSLFLIYVAMLSLGFWSAVALLREIDATAFSGRFDSRLPARAIAIYTLVLAVLNAMVWLRTIVPAVLSDAPDAFLEGSGGTTSPVFVQDLAVWLPLFVTASWWLWKGTTPRPSHRRRNACHARPREPRHSYRPMVRCDGGSRHAVCVDGGSPSVRCAGRHRDGPSFLLLSLAGFSSLEWHQVNNRARTHALVASESRTAIAPP